MSNVERPRGLIILAVRIAIVTETVSFSHSRAADGLGFMADSLLKLIVVTQNGTMVLQNKGRVHSAGVVCDHHLASIMYQLPR